jgi:lipopolysaccharide transport system ATP-binding protein
MPGFKKPEEDLPMSSSDIAIRVEGVSMRFELYDAPRDQLKQFILPRLQRMAGLEPKQYFREFWALKDISFDIKKGESIGIVGRNGSGKSTLLQIITGTLSPTVGTVETNGRIAALLELGSGFNPGFTGRENVYLNGALLGFSSEQIDERFDAIASFADIGEHLDQPVKTYSSGMLVRLAFAVQVQVEPDILIVDEALAVGDALFQKRCLQRMDKLLLEGTTLLFVSHDQESVRTITNRALLLDCGRARIWGNSSDVLLEYRKLLHEDESSFLAKHLETQKANVSNTHSPVFTKKSNVSDRYSFGDYDVAIFDVTLLCNGFPCKGNVAPGDKVSVVVKYYVHKIMSRLAFGFRIRNKEGVKVYSGSSFADDLNKVCSNPDYKGIWHKTFPADKAISMEMSFECNLGDGFYEIQVFACEEQIFAPGHQRMLHWKDEAAFFTVLMDKSKRWFGGVCDLKLKYELTEL